MSENTHYNGQKIPSGLIVDKWDEWDQAIGMAPEEFYEGWQKNLPGRSLLRVRLSGHGQGEIDFTLSEKGHTLIEAERSFYRPNAVMTLKEVRVAPQHRRQGLGKIFLSNQIDLARKWGLDTLKLRAGREDGPYFWSRRHAQIERLLTGNDADRFTNLFRKSVLESLMTTKDALSTAFIDAAEGIIEGDLEDPNIALAYLEGDYRGQGQVRKIFRRAGEFRAELDLKNPVQLAKIRASLTPQDKDDPSPLAA